MEEVGSDEASSAVIVDSTDLATVIAESGMDESKVEEIPSSDLGSDSEERSSSDSDEFPDAEKNKEHEVESEAESENNKRIRAATNQYLEGSFTLADLTAALEKCSDAGAGEKEGSSEGNNKVEASKSTKVTMKTPGPSPRKSPAKKRKKVTGSQVETEEVSLDRFGFDTSMLPPESTWEVRPKYTADFYSTGDKVSSFTLRRRRKMSPTVQGMMGEAHLRYVRGEQKSAIAICQEIIKEQPTITDPYALLSLIYYDLNEYDRALRFGMIGALLDPKHCKEWPRLAEMSLDQGNIQQAISCYTHALSVTPDVPDLYFRRCELMKTSGDVKGAIKGYLRLIQALPKEGKACVQAYRKISQLYYMEKDKEKAYHFLNQAVKEYPAFITNIEVNLILELMRRFKKYVESIQLLQTHSKVEFKPPLEEADFETRPSLSRALSKRDSVEAPQFFPAELNVKLITSLIHLEAYDLAKSLLPQLLAKPIEKFGDLYLEVAEAYMAKERWQSSLELTSMLVKSPKMKEASLCFLRHAETLYSLGKNEEAAGAYETVISLVPNHHVAKLNYALILQKLGRSEDALQTLNQDQEEKIIDHHLIAEKCKIYIQQKRPYELIETAQFLFSRHCHTLRSKEDTLGVSLTTHSDKRYEAVQLHRTKREEHPHDKRASFMERPEITDSEWQIYLHVCQVCLDMERYDLLERFTYTAWSSELFGLVPKMEKSCGFHSYLASLLNLDQELLAPHVKFQSLSPEGVKSAMALNLFGKALQRHDYVRYGRHLIRLVKKSPQDNNLKLLTAHHNFSCGNYKTALTQYFYLHSKSPDNPLVCLMIVSCLISVLSQKTSTNRSQIAIQIIAFLQTYMKCRGNCQEMYYNVGRTLHLLGAFQDAIFFYKRALEMNPISKSYNGNPICSEMKKTLFGDENILDLRKDILYNLAHLYNSLGAPKKARVYMSQLRV